MNYYEHHIGDYDADTAHLSWLEDMAYTRLIRLYYRKESPVPADIGEACRLVRAVTREQKQAVESVLKEFFRLAADGWHQKRCDADVERYQKKAERNREVGKLGGRPRKVETQTEPTNNPGGLFQEPTQNPPQSPDTRHQEEKEKPRKRVPNPERPADVSEQVWSDWLQLRKGKRAPVTETVLAEVIAEAGKAGISVERFLSVWCVRGSQGLEAAWLKPHERAGPAAPKTFRERDAEHASARYAEMSGGLIGAKKQPPMTFENEHATTLALD
ncbi:MAG: DUF1376 domain-containing protein [Pseudomonadota bacterium]